MLYFSLLEKHPSLLVPPRHYAFAIIRHKQLVSAHTHEQQINLKLLRRFSTPRLRLMCVGKYRNKNYMLHAKASLTSLDTGTFRSHVLQNQGNRAQSADSSKFTTILGLSIFAERSFNFHFSVLEIRFATAIVVKSNICQRHKQIDIHLNCG